MSSTEDSSAVPDADLPDLQSKFLCGVSLYQELERQPSSQSYVKQLTIFWRVFLSALTFRLCETDSMITNTTRYASLNRIKEENCVGYTQDTCLSQRICRKKLRSYVKSVEGGVGEQTHKFLYHIQELNSKDC